MTVASKVASDRSRSSAAAWKLLTSNAARPPNCVTSSGCVSSDCGRPIRSRSKLPPTAACCPSCATSPLFPLDPVTATTRAAAGSASSVSCSSLVVRPRTEANAGCVGGIAGFTTTESASASAAATASLTPSRQSIASPSSC